MPSLRRYLVEVLVLAALFGVVAVAVARAFVPGEVLFPVILATAVITALDVVVFAILRQGLSVGSARHGDFMTWWGLAVVAKFTFLGLSVVAVLLAKWGDAPLFLVSLAVAFALFSMHQMVRLMPGADGSDPSVVLPATSRGGLA